MANNVNICLAMQFIICANQQHTDLGTGSAGTTTGEGRSKPNCQSDSWPS